MEEILQAIAGIFGLDPGTLALIMGIVYAIATALGKSIPESATGVLGIIRRVLKVIALYVPNKVRPGVTVSSTSAAIADSNPEMVSRQ